MLVKKVEFVKSSPSLKECPPPDMPEYAFIGRSNVGKSSLINMLGGHGKLAKISATPGKTRLINHFRINDSWYLVDLPGYGYAKVSKSMRKDFDRILFQYLSGRENLYCTFVLIDSRLAPQANDLQFINQLGEYHLPFAVVFTKTDKISRNKVADNIRCFQEELLKNWEELPPCFCTSSVTKEGKEEILDFIEKTNLSGMIGIQ